MGRSLISSSYGNPSLPKDIRNVHVWIKDIFYLEQKLGPCQVGGDNGRLNFTSGGLKSTTAWVYTDVSQRLFVVCSIPSQVWVTLLVAPNTISSSGIHAGFGAIRPIVSFRCLVYICHHSRMLGAVKSIKSISVQVTCVLRIQGKSTKS